MSARGYVGTANGQPGRYRGVVSSCIKCGRYTPVGESYCSQCRPIRDVSARGGGATIAKFRRQVLLLAGT